MNQILLKYWWIQSIGLGNLTIPITIGKGICLLLLGRIGCSSCFGRIGYRSLGGRIAGLESVLPLEVRSWNWDLPCAGSALPWKFGWVVESWSLDSSWGSPAPSGSGPRLRIDNQESPKWSWYWWRQPYSDNHVPHTLPLYVSTLRHIT